MENTSPFAEMVELQMVCPSCLKQYSITISADQFDAVEKRRKNGKYIQEIINDPTICESLLSGLCPECQNEFFN